MIQPFTTNTEGNSSTKITAAERWAFDTLIYLGHGEIDGGKIVPTFGAASELYFSRLTGKQAPEVELRQINKLIENIKAAPDAVELFLTQSAIRSILDEVVQNASPAGKDNKLGQNTHLPSITNIISAAFKQVRRG